jgi:hypothetical protein
LSDPSQRSKYAKFDMELQRKSGRIDLTLLNYENQQSLKQQFRKQVLQADQLFNDVGLPGMEFRSSNLYSSLLKYDVTAGDSPMATLLNRMFFNVNPLKQGFEAINFGGSTMLSTESLRRITNNANFTPAQTAKILTFDVETTGVTADSQVRQFAYQVGDERKVFSYRNPLMDTATVTSSGQSRRMSDFVNLAEGADEVFDMGEDGKIFAGHVKQMLTAMENSDHISAHNALFDLGKLGDTLHATGALRADEELRDQFFRVLDKTQTKDNYLIDTAETMRSYFTDEASRVVGESGDRASRLVSQLLGPEMITKAGIGGGAAPVSVENLALNSNLFELIEKHEPELAKQMTRDLARGSHIADTDIAIQASLDRYKNKSIRGELGGDRLTFRFGENGEVLGNPLSEFETFARSRIFKSQALTPVTNIASVQHVSNTVMDYLRTDKGMQGMELRVSGTDLGLDTGDGILRFSQNDNGYKFMAFGSTAAQDVEMSTARQYITRTLNEASSTSATVESSIRVGGEAINIAARNLADESILNLGFSFTTASTADSMVRAKSVLSAEGLPEISRSITDEDLLIRSLGLTNEQFGVSQSYGNIVQRITGASRGNQPTVNQIRNPLSYNVDVLNSYTANAAKAGLPFTTIGDMNRIMSVGLAEATASIGEAAGINLTHGRNAKLTTETGLSFFKMQDVTRMGTITADAIDPLRAPSKVMAGFTQMFDIGQNATTGRQTLSVKAFEGLDNLSGDIMSTDLNRFTLSFVSGSGEGANSIPSRVNLTYKVQAETAQQESRALADYMLNNVETFQDHMRQMVGQDARMKSYIDELIQFKTMPEIGDKRQKVAARLAEQIQETGIVFGYAEGESADAIHSAMRRSGIDMVENDVRLKGMAMRIAHADAGSGTLTLSAISDTTADEMVGRTSAAAQQETFAALDKATELNEIFTDSGKKRRAQRMVTAAANSSATDDAVDLTRRPAMDFSTRMTDFYIAHKPKIGFAALGLAVAGVGYYIAKDRREQRLYEETRQVQDFEPATQAPQRQNFNAMSSPQSTRRDPLVTAGVVGNLDRNKIGHSRMGPNKYNHLYGN